MNLAEAITRFAAGGSLILAVSYLGKSKNPYIAGLAVLFPIVTIVGYYFLSLTNQQSAMQKIVLAGLFGLPTTLVFLIVVYFAIAKLPIFQALLCGVLGWLITAVLLILMDKNYLNIIIR